MHSHKKASTDLEIDHRVVLVGNPNVGKSVIFNHLTGKYATVSNYPGTTVEIFQGIKKIDGKTVEVIDSPGVNSLMPMSEDEQVARRVLIEKNPDMVIHVADAKNLRRTLFITFSLLEMGFPLILNLNMIDEARSRGIEIDAKGLEEKFDIPVIKTVATEGQGIKTLKGKIFSRNRGIPIIFYHPEIEKAISNIEKILGNDLPLSKRSIAVLMLRGDKNLKNWIKERYGVEAVTKIENIIKETQNSFNHPLNYIITQTYEREAKNIIKNFVKITKPPKHTLADKLSTLTMNPITGIPIFLGVVYLVFLFVGVFGAGILVDFFESTIFGKYINPITIAIVEFLFPFEIVQILLIGDFEIITMGITWAIAIVLPIIATFFLAFSLLEDSGYLPRLATMADRVLKKVGLNGKAVLPLVLGTGCDTMATMTTRILDTRKEKVIAALMLALGIPCSAQLGVIFGLLAYVGPIEMFLVFGVVILQLLFVAYLASKIMPGEKSDFIIEIPPLRIPKLSNVLIKTWNRVEWFLKEAVPLFILGTILITVLDIIGGLSLIIEALKPIVSGMLGLPEETTIAFILGFLRRDFGAAGLYVLAQDGLLSPIQIVVSCVVLTLFVPCIANFLMIAKELGTKTAISMGIFVIVFAFFVGAILNFILRTLVVLI